MLNKSTLLFLFLCAAAFVIWKAMNRGVIIEHTALAGKFESAVNEILNREGIEDRHILKTIRMEHKTKFPTYSSWIETEREIKLPSRKLFPRLKDKLKSAAMRYSLTYFTSEPYYKNQSGKPIGSIIEIGRQDQIFQRLILLYSYP